MIKIIKQCLKRSLDLAHPKYGGLCYVASEAVYHLLGGKKAGLKSMFLYHENKPHWFLKQNNKIIDLTASQFKTRPDYKLARGKGFLTKGPSRRTKVLIERCLNITKT